MKNFNRSEKSKGILAFASNTPDVNYEEIAKKTLWLAKVSTGLPIHLELIRPPERWHNIRTDIDSKKIVKWNNYGRCNAYDVTPFDETIVVDIDLLITTNRLVSLFDYPGDYLLCHNNTQLSGETVQDIVWATVFMFRKTPASKQFFELVGRIQRNWDYYKVLFGLKIGNFRNDYAFAIAERILGGHTQPLHTRMPFGITTVDYPIKSIDINDSWMVVRNEDNASILPRTDLHVMSKAWLQSPALDKFIKDANG